jgi:TMEM175 potassium channel family protein
VGKSRLEAFSDGVIAIIITIMVLELRAPHGADLETLAPLLPAFLSYVLSFVYVGIYWNNHHHLLHTLEHGVSGAILWANLHLLFWLSLFPVTTAWMGENEFTPMPSAVYGFVLLMAGIAYLLLERAIIAADGASSVLRRAVGKDWKGKLSPLFYVAAIVSTLWWQWVAEAIYVLVALLWLIPDRRIERALKHGANS